MLATFALIAALLFTPPPETCAAINAILGGETTPWVGYERGGWDLPEDIAIVERIDFAGDGGLWLYTSESQPGTRWYWWFLSYEAMTDANGNHLGQHEFCAVIVHD